MCRRYRCTRLNYQPALLCTYYHIIFFAHIIIVRNVISLDRHRLQVQPSKVEKKTERIYIYIYIFVVSEITTAAKT